MMNSHMTISKNDDGTFRYEVCGHDRKKKKGKKQDGEGMEIEVYKPFVGSADTLDEAIRKASKKFNGQKDMESYINS